MSWDKRRYESRSSLIVRDLTTQLLPVYIVLVPIVDLLNGVLISRSVYGLGPAYKMLACVLLLAFIVTSQVSTRVYVLLLVYAVAILSQLLNWFVGYPQAVSGVDIALVARGPVSFVVFVSLLLSLGAESLRNLARRYFIATWWVVTVSILFFELFGFSLPTYEAAGMSSGSKASYVAPNEVTFIYSVSWMFLVFKSTGLRAIPIYTIVSAVVLFMIGTKSGFLVIAITFFWLLCEWMRIGVRRAVALFIIVAVIALLYAEVLFYLLGPYLIDWVRIEFFIERYGVISALTGGRVNEIKQALSLIADYSIADLLFGVGYQEFWSLTSDDAIESDPFDLMGGGGFLAVGMFFAPIFLILCLVLRNNSDYRMAAFIFVIGLYSIFVGHLAYASTPIITIALLVTCFLKGIRIESARHSILV